jgi:hypothetical protein
MECESKVSPVDHKIVCFGMQKHLLEGKTLGMLWPNGVLHYDFSEEFQDQHKDIIESAIYDLQQQTCVRFVRRTTEPTYILLRNTNHAYVLQRERAREREGSSARKHTCES